MTVHEFTLVPADRTNIEALEKANAEFNSMATIDEKGAVFGQVWMDDGIAFRCKVHVFTGKARDYLQNHLKKAMQMQDHAREGQKE